MAANHFCKLNDTAHPVIAVKNCWLAHRLHLKWNFHTALSTANNLLNAK